MPPGNEMFFILTDERGHQCSHRLQFHWLGAVCVGVAGKLLTGEDWVLMDWGLFYDMIYGESLQYRDLHMETSHSYNIELI